MKNKLIIAAFTMLAAGSVLTACGSNNAVEFQDPLVERCVRIELGKEDGETITAKECASLEKLTIDCDLEYSYVNNWYTMVVTDCGSYVDLCDLEHMTGLKELVIDNDVSRDMFVNLDSIKECTKLESLSVRYNPMETSYYGTIPMGYKYLADIIEEMPKLTYLNLGYPVAKEHQDQLAGDNDGLKFEKNHPENAYYNRIVNNDVIGSDTRIMETKDIDEYSAYWTYGYNENELRKEPYVLVVNSQEELDELFRQLSEDTEDLHIQYGKIEEGGSLDVQGVEKFTKLKTFSLYKTVYTMGDNSIEEKVLEVDNLDALASCQELYSVSLCGVKGDLDALASMAQIKELGLSKCAFDSADFLEEMSGLRELVVVYNECDELQEYLLDNGEAFEELKYLRYEGGETSDYKGIEKYPNLESVSIAYSCGVEDVKYLAQCPKLAYLFFGTQEESLDIEELEDLVPLKYLYIDGMGNMEELDGVEDVVGTRIISLYMPHMKYDLKDVNNWIEAAGKNENLSCFIPHRTFIDGFTMDEGHSKLDYEDLYEQGVMCRFADVWMCMDPEKYPTIDEAMEAPK